MLPPSLAAVCASIFSLCCGSERPLPAAHSASGQACVLGCPGPQSAAGGVDTVRRGRVATDVALWLVRPWAKRHRDPRLPVTRSLTWGVLALPQPRGPCTSCVPCGGAGSWQGCSSELPDLDALFPEEACEAFPAVRAELSAWPVPSGTWPPGGVGTATSVVRCTEGHFCRRVRHSRRTLRTERRKGKLLQAFNSFLC